MSDLDAEFFFRIQLKRFLRNIGVFLKRLCCATQDHESSVTQGAYPHSLDALLKRWAEELEHKKNTKKEMYGDIFSM